MSTDTSHDARHNKRTTGGRGLARRAGVPMVRSDAQRGTEPDVANKFEEEPEDEVEDEPNVSRIISVLAETNRRDRWTVAPNTSMVTFLARSHFDFRQVEAEGKVVELDITCVFGNITIVVPEGTKVQLSGFSFLATANCDVASPEDATSPLPKIVVNATTVFGRISIRTPNAADLAPPVDTTAVLATAPAAGTSSVDDAGHESVWAPLAATADDATDDTADDGVVTDDAAAETVGAAAGDEPVATPSSLPVAGARAALTTTPADAAALIERESVV